MSWVQVEFALRPALLDQVEDQLLRIGCSALTLLNGGEDPVLEPQPGEVPLWQEVKVQALFPTSADFAAVRECLASLLGNVAIDVQFLGDQDWQAAARTHAVNEVFADRLWLLPKEKPTPLMRQGLTPLYLEPGLAFGSGGASDYKVMPAMVGATRPSWPASVGFWLRLWGVRYCCGFAGSQGCSGGL